MPSPLEFSVRFSERGFISRADNSFGLWGPAQLTITQGALVIRGRQRSTFGVVRRALELRLPLEHVRNVTFGGERVRFEVHQEGKPPQHATVWMVEDEQARRLAEALPRQYTEEHRALLAESHEYSRRLQELPAGVGVARALIVINAAIFGAMVLAGADFVNPDPQIYVRWGSNYAPLSSTGEWWRLASSMFLHFGVIHLVLNCIGLWSLGPLTERLYGSLRFTLIYVFAGVIGSLASMLWNPGGNSVGASGAIFGVLGALIAFVINRANGIPASIVMTQRNSLLVFLGYNLVFGFFHPAIDNAAHIGGLVSGCLLGFLFARPLDARARMEPRAGRVLLIVTGWLLLAGGAYEWVRKDLALQEDQQFRLGMDWIEAREPAMVRRFAALAEDLFAGRMEEAAFVAEMESAVLPFWREAVRRLGPDSVHADSRMRDLRLAVRDYVRSRARSSELLTEGARSGDIDTLNAGQRELMRARELIDAVNAAR